MEKKKRFRPTLTAYRALEEENRKLREELSARKADVPAELESQIEGTSLVVKDCDGWRDRYRSLKEECDVLKRSNGLMEKELSRRNEFIGLLNRRASAISEELSMLKSRGLWDRIMNRGV